MLRYKLERVPFLEEKVRKVRENGKIICLDINQLMLSEENRFAFTIEVAEEANSYLEKNRHEYGLKKPILHVLSDRMNEAGFSRPEGYLYPYPIKPGPYFIKEEGHWINLMLYRPENTRWDLFSERSSPAGSFAAYTIRFGRIWGYLASLPWSNAAYLQISDILQEVHQA
jgi:hypothetical protein